MGMLAWAVAVVLCSFAAPRDARAVAGDIDAAFGDGGVTRIDIGRTSAIADAVFLHGDGKVTLVASAGETLALARFTAGGTPDPSFGDDGRVLTRPAEWVAGDRAGVLQPDGKLVVVGRARQSFGYHCSVARFLADGSLDPDFGTGGVTTIGIASSGFDEIGDAVLQPDGKILVVSSASGKLGLLRLNDDGTPDEAFGSGGRVELVIAPRGSQGRALALQSDGRIVVVGIANMSSATANRYYVARLDASGALDSSFGDAGRVILDVGGRPSGAADVAVQPDDRIVVVVEESAPGGDVVALRFTRDGAPDPTFGVGGKARAIGHQFLAFRAALEPGGSVLVAGVLRHASGFTLARVLGKGVLQRRFGAGGFVPTTLEDSERIQALSVAPNGDVVAAGATWAERDFHTSKVAVVRYTSDGGRERSFGDRGVVSVTVRAANDTPTGIATAPDGTIVVAGWSVGGGTGYDMAAARLDADGTLDDGFGVGGKIRVDSSSRDELGDGSPERDRPHGIAVQADGRIVGAGSRHDGQDAYKLVRLTATGDLDLSFGAAGGVRFGSSCDRFLYSVLVDAGGAILAAGAVTTDCGGGVELVRVLPDGTRDPSFGTNGVLATELRGDAAGLAVPLALGGDGSFVVGGRVATEDQGAVARYGSDDAPDAGFGVDGIAAIDFAEFASGFGALAVAGNGSVLAAAGYGSENLSLVRLDASGTIDGDFGNQGLASADFDGGQEHATALALQSDGKIVVAGVSVLGPAVRAVAARFTEAGELDPSFGSGGKVVLPVNPAQLWDPVSLAIDKNGGILLAEAVRSASSIDFAVTRLAGDSASICGNGAVEPAESCDDGNVASSDGCSSGCAIETCFRCAGAPSLCTAAGEGDPACEPIASCPASGDQSYSDGDGDGRDDVCDHCPDVASLDDDDADHDGVGDACDLCPLDADDSNADEDADGVGDQCDDCDAVVPLVGTRLLLAGLDSAPGDDRLVLLGSFALSGGETLESLLGAIEIEVHDLRDSVAFDWVLRNGDTAQQTGWKAAAAPWTWRYQSIAGKLPKVRGMLRLDPERPGYAQLKVVVHRGAFSSLEPELPLRAVVRFWLAGNVCAKVVHTEEEPTSCARGAGGTMRCR